MLCDDLDQWDGGAREVQEGEDICIHIADSLHCTAETNTLLECNYTPIKKCYKKHTVNKNSPEERLGKALTFK